MYENAEKYMAVRKLLDEHAQYSPGDFFKALMAAAGHTNDSLNEATKIDLTTIKALRNPEKKGQLATVDTINKLFEPKNVLFLPEDRHGKIRQKYKNILLFKCSRAKPLEEIQKSVIEILLHPDRYESVLSMLTALCDANGINALELGRRASMSEDYAYNVVAGKKPLTANFLRDVLNPASNGLNLPLEWNGSTPAIASWCRQVLYRKAGMEIKDDLDHQEDILQRLRDDEYKKMHEFFKDYFSNEEGVEIIKKLNALPASLTGGKQYQIGQSKFFHLLNGHNTISPEDIRAFCALGEIETGSREFLLISALENGARRPGWQFGTEITKMMSRYSWTDSKLYKDVNPLGNWGVARAKKGITDDELAHMAASMAAKLKTPPVLSSSTITGIRSGRQLPEWRNARYLFNTLMTGMGSEEDKQQLRTIFMDAGYDPELLNATPQEWVMRAKEDPQMTTEALIESIRKTEEMCLTSQEFAGKIGIENANYREWAKNIQGGYNEDSATRAVEVINARLAENEQQPLSEEDVAYIINKAKEIPHRQISKKGRGGRG